MIGRETVERLPDGLLLKWYLLSSYCYYQLDISPLTDEAFDRLCVRLDERFDHIDAKHYWEKKLVNREELKAGTCLLPQSKYPHIVFHVAHEYAQACINRSILKELEPNLLPAAPRPTRIVRTPQPASKEPPRPTRIIRSRPA